MGPPDLLQGTGWTRTTMKIGDTINVQGSLAKNGSKRLNARNVTTPDGKKMGAASSEGVTRSEEHTSELQSHHDLVCRLLLEKKKSNKSSKEAAVMINHARL